MRLRATLLSSVALAIFALSIPAITFAVEKECELEPRTACFGIESVGASLSTTQAGAHPDLSFSFEMKQDPQSNANEFGLKDGYATPRTIRFELPPGLIGDPNALGVPQQCTVQELIASIEFDDGCPNGSQVGRSIIYAYTLHVALAEPVYMMQPPGGDVVARLGTIAGVYPVFIDLRVRSESDYGLVAEISDAPVAARLVKVNTTTWGVPADPTHDTERCSPAEAFSGRLECSSFPPGSRQLPFMTNPTRCGAPLEMSVAASSWSAPDIFDTESASFPAISGCDKLPFGPDLTVTPTSGVAASPTGANVTIRLPAADGADVLEPSQIRGIRVQLPQGLAFNPSAGDGLGICSSEQVRFGTRKASKCPDAAKLADTEFDVSGLERKLKGSIYLREPEPSNPFRIWIVADDLGAHVKLEGELDVDKQTGQITSVTSDIPQFPVREAMIAFKSGDRAPLITPSACGTYLTDYEFVPWSGGPSVRSTTPMEISEGCDTGGFVPELSAGTADPSAAQHSPFFLTLKRGDGEQNPMSLRISLPPGLAATFKGIPRCEAIDAATGACPMASKIGHVIAAIGAGPAPLWVPQAGKRSTAIYLGGPYRGRPLSIVAVVPRQAGPFDFGDEIVRSAVDVDPRTAQASVESDPLPQVIEGIPIPYRVIHVAIDRDGFTLNPTGCAPKRVEALVSGVSGAVARPTSPFAAVNCASLSFRPRLGLKMRGGTRRGAFPALRFAYRPRAGSANLSHLALRFPSSEFIEQGHFRTICTRVQFAAGAGFGSRCPKASIYGHVRVFTPLLDDPLEGPVFLRSSNHNLPDPVLALHGPPGLPIQLEVPTRVDSVNGNLRVIAQKTPDAPITKVVVNMQGGKKGLFVNSTNLCKGKVRRARVHLEAHNGRNITLRPKVRASCGKRTKKARRAAHRRR